MSLYILPVEKKKIKYMKLVVLKERHSFETRVALSPEIAKKYVSMGLELWVEEGAGQRSYFEDAHYEKAGAKLFSFSPKVLADADILLKVQKPLLKGEGEIDEITPLKRGACLIGLLGGLSADEVSLQAYKEKELKAFSLELVPRITRAQTMDVLSSQSNLAGFRAVIEAAHAFGRVFPMMMTAAGTLMPAKVLILGAGVAGLQAIATAKRLGAVVSAYDVRPVAKEQVESLGASFLCVDSIKESGEGQGGYAKEMSEAYQKAQKELLTQAATKANIVITTALIPGKKAPVLLTEDMLQGMVPGSIIVDMAVEMGGNCSLSKLDKVVDHKGIKILGHPNLPARIPTDASTLYAKNIAAFLGLLWDAEKKELKVNKEDEIIQATLLTK